MLLHKHFEDPVAQQGERHLDRVEVEFESSPGHTDRNRVKLTFDAVFICLLLYSIEPVVTELVTFPTKSLLIC